jgi:hypothetical protein
MANNQNEIVMAKFEGCLEDLQETFGDWIERVGGWKVWNEANVITLVTHTDQPWPTPVPFLETSSGNFTWDPNGQRWLDGDELDELIQEYME